MNESNAVVILYNVYIPTAIRHCFDKNILKETMHWNKMIDLTPLTNHRAYYTYNILCPRVLFILDNWRIQATSPFPHFLFFIDVKNAYCRDI